MKSFSLFTFSILLSITVSAQLRFIGHRGASYYAPENSLAAMQLAWELGADGAECDIQLTKDNKIVLWHDGNTERLTGKKSEIAKSNFSELKKLDIKLSKSNSPYFKGQKMPLLKDVLKSVPDDQLLVIEIKCGKEVFPKLQKDIKKYQKTGNIAYIGFGFETIVLAKSLFPETPCYYLSSSKEDVLNKIPEIKKAKLDGVDLNSKIIDQQLVDELRKANLEIWAWTVDTLDETLRLKKLGINVITTNRPSWLKEQILTIK